MDLVDMQKFPDSRFWGKVGTGEWITLDLLNFFAQPFPLNV